MTPPSGEAWDLLRGAGAVLEGHFQYASGRHGALYIEKFRLLEDPATTARLCAAIASHFRDGDGAGDGPVELVAGPTTGGVILAYETARALGVHAFFAESADDGGREFRRGFQFRPGQRTLVVDDVLTTGGSLRDTVAAVRAGGGEPVGVGVVVDRSGGRTDLGLPLFACMTLDIETFAPEDCPQCADAAAPPLTIT